MEYIRHPRSTHCDVCQFNVAAHLPQPGIHERVHQFILEEGSEFVVFVRDLSKMEQVACMPFVMLKEGPEPDHIPGPPVKGFELHDAKTAPNLSCVCLVCMMFRTCEQRYCRMQSLTFQIKIMDKMRTRSDFNTIRHGLELGYNYDRLGEEFRLKLDRENRRERRKVKNRTKVRETIYVIIFAAMSQPYNIYVFIIFRI